MLLSKEVLEKSILNPKYMPWRLNQQICKKKVEVSIKKSNKKGQKKSIKLG